MIRILSFWVLLQTGSVGIACAQNLLQGKITDAQTHEPLVGANVLVPNTTLGVVTDAQGAFTLPVAAPVRELQVSLVGYTTQWVKVTRHPLSIALEPAPVNLQPVVVSGSREQQARTQVPVAISKISPQLMQDTKGTALYQLLNKVAGVYMVNLGNEQHTIAIRQPVTYNALYLYMEDGVPIRPTGIFNHNALYEINMAGAENIEVIKGPASSLYGSNAIGGAINFSTQHAQAVPTARFSLQGDHFGYRRVDASAGNTFGKLGLFAGGYYARQRNGWQDYTNFDKYSFNLRGDYQLSERTRLTASATYNYLNTQTPGNLDSAHFYSRQYGSNQQFAYRKVEAFRASTRLEHQWNRQSHTFATLFYRNNSTGQLPSYAISDVRDRQTGQYLRSFGQVNNQSFQSYGLLVQHRQDFALLHSRLIVGAYLDDSPNTYWAKYLNITKDVAQNYYTGYTNTDSLTDQYRIQLLNYALYTQYEMQLTPRLRVVGGLRYDRVRYNFSNGLPLNRTNKKAQQFNDYNVLAPKLGFTYDLDKNRGVYGNVSTGFQPPETSTLYSSRQVQPLKQAGFTNYELGGWMALFDRKLYLELSAYQLDGRNEIISILQPDNSTQYENVGATRHQGIEYTLTYAPISDINFRLSGTNARHIYLDYSEVQNTNGQNQTVNYNGKRMNNAPAWIANSEVFYKPRYLPGARIGLEWQHVNPYYTNNANTKTYQGYNLLNLRLGYRFTQASLKGFEVWANIINLSNQLYATTVLSNQYSDSYTASAPRTLTLGIGYNLSGK